MIDAIGEDVEHGWVGGMGVAVSSKLAREGSWRVWHLNRDLRETREQPGTSWGRAFLAEGTAGAFPDIFKDYQKCPGR